MANRELAKKIKAAITAKPELWDQHTWAAVTAGAVTSSPEGVDEGEDVNLTCGTTMCFAGWACHLSGEKIDWRAVETEGDRIVAHRLKNGRSIDERAIELLEISYDDAGYLFYAYDEKTAMDRLDQIIEDGYVHDPYRVDDDDEY